MRRPLPDEQAIVSAHFGIFNDTNVQTLVEYEVKASDLSKMYLLRDHKDINDHLQIFGLIWDEKSWLTHEAINRLYTRKGA